MPELRRDPVTGRWVIIATDPAKRPEDFARSNAGTPPLPVCPFCPGNEQKTPPEILAYRTRGSANEPGWTLRVIPSKFPVLRVEGTLNRKAEGLYDRMDGVGAHELIIETPEHEQTLATMPLSRIQDLVWAFRDRTLDLRRDGRLRQITLFKNHGEGAGGVFQHPHSQLIALPVVPKRVQEELDGSKRYAEYRERCVFCDIIMQELDRGGRVVLESDHFVALCPYAARFAFEIWILPKAHASHAETISHPEVGDVAVMLQRMVRKLDATLEHPPWNMVLHTAPMQDVAMPHYHWHIELIPRVTRVAGFEWGSGFYVNPTPPEEAARYLRDAQG